MARDFDKLPSGLRRVNPISRILRNALAALRSTRTSLPIRVDEVYTRAAERFGAKIPVFIGPRGTPPTAGALVNISLQGAAVRISKDTEWLTSLDQGDELHMTGLLPTPVACWGVVVDGDMLRVHFSADAGQRDKLFEGIGSLLRH
jgi:hypothetical protein